MNTTVQTAGPLFSASSTHSRPCADLWRALNSDVDYVALQHLTQHFLFFFYRDPMKPFL
jgi:hypothetical protein